MMKTSKDLPIYYHIYTCLAQEDNFTWCSRPPLFGELLRFVICYVARTAYLDRDGDIVRRALDLALTCNVLCHAGKIAYYDNWWKTAMATETFSWELEGTAEIAQRAAMAMVDGLGKDLEQNVSSLRRALLNVLEFIQRKGPTPLLASDEEETSLDTGSTKLETCKVLQVCQETFSLLAEQQDVLLTQLEGGSSSDAELRRNMSTSVVFRALDARLGGPAYIPPDTSRSLPPLQS